MVGKCDEIDCINININEINFLEKINQLEGFRNGLKKAYQTVLYDLNRLRNMPNGINYVDDLIVKNFNKLDKEILSDIENYKMKDNN